MSRADRTAHSPPTTLSDWLHDHHTAGSSASANTSTSTSHRAVTQASRCSHARPDATASLACRSTSTASDASTLPWLPLAPCTARARVRGDGSAATTTEPRRSHMRTMPSTSRRWSGHPTTTAARSVVAWDSTPIVEGPTSLSLVTPMSMKAHATATKPSSVHERTWAGTDWASNAARSRSVVLGSCRRCTSSESMAFTRCETCIRAGNGSIHRVVHVLTCVLWSLSEVWAANTTTSSAVSGCWGSRAPRTSLYAFRTAATSLGNAHTPSELCEQQDDAPRPVHQQHVPHSRHHSPCHNLQRRRGPGAARCTRSHRGSEADYGAKSGVATSTRGGNHPLHESRKVFDGRHASHHLFQAVNTTISVLAHSGHTASR